MGTFESIKDSLVRLFKLHCPTFDVHCEEIVRTQGDEHIFDNDNYIFIAIIPVGNKTLDMYHTDRTITVDAAMHTHGELNAEYMDLAQELDGMIRPVFRFSDRAITVPDVSFRVVDRVLHCTFTLSFIDSVDETEPLPLMGELDIENKTD